MCWHTGYSKGPVFSGSMEYRLSVTSELESWRLNYDLESSPGFSVSKQTELSKLGGFGCHG